VVHRPGRRLAWTSSSLAAQSLPWDHCYCTKGTAWQCILPSLSWLSEDWSDWLGPRRPTGCHTSDCLHCHRFCETFAPNKSGRLPTTPAKANTCCCGAAPFARIVTCGKSWLHKERLYHKRGPIPLILHATNIEYPYESTDVCLGDSLYPVQIQWQASNWNQCRHFYPSSCLHITFAAALCSHRCEFRLNLHPWNLPDDTVTLRGRKPGGNVPHGVGFRVCFETRAVALCKSADVETVQNAGSVANTGGKGHGVVHRNNRYI